MTQHSSAGRDERGASLLLVLVFITALSMVIGALLFGSSTAQKATVVTATLADANYATDSGVEYGIEQVRANEGFCPVVSGPLKITDGTTTANSSNVGSATAGFRLSDVGLAISGGSIPVGATIVSWTNASSVVISDNAGALASGVSLIVERGRMDATALGSDPRLAVNCIGDINTGYTPQTLSSWAVVTLDPGNNSLRTQSGGTKQVSGPIYVAGNFNLQVPLRANEFPPDPYQVGDGNGYVFQSNTASGGCVRPSASDLITTNFDCTSMPPPDPKPQLPPPPNLAAAPTNIGACRIFHPGKYNSSRPFSLSPNGNYLGSGIYYLENLGTIDMGTSQVFGGAVDTATGEAQALAANACGTDAQAGVTNGDKGVEIILGAKTKIDVNRADAEFMAFHPATNDQGAVGVSIRTVATAAFGYQVSNIGPTAVGLTVAGGSNPHFAVHGAVYIPNAKVEIFATNSSQAAILGGVVAYDLLLQSSASGSGFEVQVAGGRPRSRSNVIIEASLPVSASKTVKGRAVIDVHVSRIVTDGKTDGSNLLVSEFNTAQFSKADEGVSVIITGAGITTPIAATIQTFVTESSVRLSANIPSGTGRRLDIDPPLKRTITDGITTSGSTFVDSATANFSGADVDGIITGSGMPVGGSKIVQFVTPTRVQIAATTGPGNALSLTITRRKIVRVSVDSWRVDNL